MLVRDRAINAFVSTGNRMFINTGLLQQAGSALEVVGTMAHETGHIVHGDISRVPEAMREALLQSLGSMLIAAAAGVAASNPGVGVGAMLGGTSMAQRHFMSFSRGQEENADESAVRYLDRLGWSSRGLLDLFKRLGQEEALMVDRQDPFLLSHPLTPERQIFVQEHVTNSRFTNAPLPNNLEAAFQMVKAKLDGFLEPTDKVFRQYASDPASPAMQYARAVALHRLGHEPEAMAAIDQLVATQPTNPWLLELKAQILFESGQSRASLGPYREAVRLAPDQPLIRQSFGHAMVETGDPALLRLAIDQLQVALRQDRLDDVTWHVLGVAWGRLGDLGEANLALAEEAMLANDIPNARRFAKRASEVLKEGPSKLRALDISNAVKKENRP